MYISTSAWTGCRSATTGPKLAVERLVQESGTRLDRAAGDPVPRPGGAGAPALAKPPVVLLPARVCDQPVEVAEVAGRLAELAAGAPAGRVADLGGPEVRTFESLARAYLGATGRRRAVVKGAAGGEGLPGVPRGRAPRAQRAVGKGTFESTWRGRFGGGTDGRGAVERTGPDERTAVMSGQARMSGRRG